MKKSNVFQTGIKILPLSLLAISGSVVFSCGLPGGKSTDTMLESLTKESRESAVTEEEETINAGEGFNTEEYDRIYENPFFDPREEPLSTFSIDVDNAAYSNLRRYLTHNQLPPKDAVRIEEMVNYFTYDYPQPTDGLPFAVETEVGSCPWNKAHQLVHIGLQGRSINYEALAPSNLVFLIDASGSMSDANKLPLLKRSLKMLLEELNAEDQVAIVAYAGAAGLVLPSTPASETERIIDALDELESGGSTAGGEGILLAYDVALQNFIKGGNNRVILATDGDFNVGVSSTSDLVRLVEEKREQDVYLTLCGFGMGNYKDGRMEQISNAGNGNYFYIDNLREARKVFVTEMRANMFTIAKDVKIQVEFNPMHVKAYRLVGYENRVLENEDFNDDQKDAGELGAGHTVTALYEIVPQDAEEEARKVDALKYQKERTIKRGNHAELMTVKLRYKPIDSEVSNLLVHSVSSGSELSASANFRFSAAVAGFGMVLRESRYNETLDCAGVMELASSARGSDVDGNRAEFIELVQKADGLLKL